MIMKTQLTALALAVTLGAGSLMHSQQAKASVVVEAGVPAVAVAPPSVLYSAPVVRHGYPYAYYRGPWHYGYRYPRYAYGWHARYWRGHAGSRR